ncbi:MAG TPA: glycosyltransferase [Burkholderiales bacterium]|nr:glycosyltransferase [Burkholderiales bacterium]
MKLSVIVPAFNEEKLLAGTLASIHEAARGGSYELIVCDNNSTDRTPDIARAAGAKVVFEPVNQISRARNTGAAAASGEWLLFIDADCQPSRALFAEVGNEIEKGACIGGGCTVRLTGAPLAVRFWVAAWNALSRTLSWAAGSFFFCEARAFREAGGFSTELYAAEEIDLSRRLKRRGRLVILNRHPLATSGRKAHLYSWREHLGFLMRFIFSGGRSLRRRQDCSVWYDGRR